MKEEVLEMSSAERKRVHIIRKAEEGLIKQKKAAELLGISVRQIRRLVRRVQGEGDSGVIHKLRSQPSNHRIDPAIRERVLSIYIERYEGFGPTFAAEKMSELLGRRLSPETLRNWLKASGMNYPARRARPHRHWRKRKIHRGEMIQVDGSHHDWLEGRGPWLVLMAYIDDATNEVFARFYESEETFSVLDSFSRYVRKKGLPCSVYCDRHTAYRAMPRELNLSEQLEGISQPMSNFQRALKELEVEIIFAYSPQAKGRVERLFRTLQDRLVKEMRLRSICTRGEANLFLQGYLPRFNKKYCLSPENVIDIHRKVGNEIDLRSILCVKEYRTLKNDFTIEYRGKLYQIQEKVRCKRILIETWLDSSLHLRSEGHELRYKLIDRPKRQKKIEGIGKNHHLNRINPPPSDGLWRQFRLNSNKP